MTLWRYLLGAPRPAGGGTPMPDLDEIAAGLSRRLGVPVSVSQVEDQVVARVAFLASTDAALPESKIINRLERQLVRAITALGL